MSADDGFMMPMMGSSPGPGADAASLIKYASSLPAGDMGGSGLHESDRAERPARAFSLAEAVGMVEESEDAARAVR